MEMIDRFTEKMKVLTMICLMAVSTMFVPVAATATVGMTGCTVTATQIANDAAVVAKVALQIATASAELYPNISAEITLAANDVSNVASALISGTTTEARLIAVLQTLDTILSAIPNPTTQVIAEFLPIAIAGIEAIYSYVGTTTPALAKGALRSTISPWAGRANVKHRFGRSAEGDFKAAWNEAVKKNPGAGFAKV
jgi:uncharacterized protein YdbL (DUF1318 family)